MITRLMFAPALLAGVLAGVRPAHADHVDLVYTETNDPNQNELVVLAARDGSFQPLWRVPTGGRGRGAGLGSQGAVALSDDRLWLVAVNAGSNEVSLFFVGWLGRPILLDVAPSGGSGPISATVRQGLVYVVNADGISGLEIGWHGGLVPIDSSQPLSGPGAGPAQISITPDGDALIVAEKNTGCLDRFPLDADGRAGPLTCHPSVGQTPFGFAFTDQRRRDVLIVSEAFGGAAGASAVSSYVLDDDDLVPATRSAATTQPAACWIAVTPDQRFAYSTNTGSGTVTGFQVRHDGSLRRIDGGVTGVTGGAPIDAEVSPDGDTLYVLDDTRDAIFAFRVRHDGSLLRIGESGTLSPATVGLVVR